MKAHFKLLNSVVELPSLHFSKVDLFSLTAHGLLKVSDQFLALLQIALTLPQCRGLNGELSLRKTQEEFDKIRLHKTDIN